MGADELPRPRLARRALAGDQGVPGRLPHDLPQRGVLRRHRPRGLGGARRPEGHVSGAEWMEAVRAKELKEARDKKKMAPKQDVDKFDALGNKIEVAVVATDVDRDYVKRMTKQLKALKERVKKGDLSAEDEMYEVEDALDKANAMLKKEKEAAKKEKDAKKALEKAAKKASKK